MIWSYKGGQRQCWARQSMCKSNLRSWMRSWRMTWTRILIINLCRKSRCSSPISYQRNHPFINQSSTGIRFTTQKSDCKLFGTKSRHWARTTIWYLNLAIIWCKRSTHKTLRSFIESKWTKKKEFKVNSRRKYFQIYWKLALHANTLPLIIRMAKLANSNRKI